MYLPGQLPSGYAPPNGTYTAASGGFFNSEPAAGTGAAEVPDTNDVDDPVSALISALGYPRPGAESAPVAKPGYGDWLPGSPAVLAALSDAGIELRSEINQDNRVADRGNCPPGELPTNAPAIVQPTDGPKWLLGASVMLLLVGMSKTAAAGVRF